MLIKDLLQKTVSEHYNALCVIFQKVKHQNMALASTHSLIWKSTSDMTENFFWGSAQ